MIQNVFVRKLGIDWESRRATVNSAEAKEKANKSDKKKDPVLGN